MRKLVSVYLLPLILLVSSLGCSQELPAIDEMESSPLVPDLSAKLALNPPDEANYGHVTVSNGSSISSQISSENTIYEIISNLDLKGGTLTIPANSILRFNGGSFQNGTIIFNDTYLDGYVNFKGCTFDGILHNKEVVVSWFGASKDNSDNSAIINNVLKVIPETLVFDALYPINKTIVIPGAVTFRGIDWTESVYGLNVRHAEYGIKTSSRITAIRFEKSARLSAMGISIIGDEHLYTGRNTHDNDGPNGGPINTSGIYITTGYGYLTALFDCAIVGFTYGLNARGGYIELIKGTYFSSCRFGMFCAWTSDFICTNCRFNSNMLNYDLEDHRIYDDNPNAIRKIGAGVVVKGTGMVHFEECRFEFNFIHFMIDEAATILNVQNNIFDAATHSCIFVFNENNKENIVDQLDLYKPKCINCVDISGNTFVRGARCEHQSSVSAPGSGIVYVREADNRGMNFNFVNNVVVDSIELNMPRLEYEKNIFTINCNDDAGVINSTGNDFSHCKAKSVVGIVKGSTGRFTIKDSGSNFGNISHVLRNNSVVDIQKMEVRPDGKIVIWNTLTDGDTNSMDVVVDPLK